MRYSKTASGREAPPEKTVAQAGEIVLKSTVSDILYEREIPMDFEKLAAERYSLRKFSDQPVEEETLARILEAGRNAPTAHNNQPQRILVLRSKEALALADGCARSHFDSPVMLVVSYDPADAWIREEDGKNHGEIDAAIATTQMMLQAADLGLGTTYIGMFDPEKLRAAFPKELAGLVPIALLALGYPAENARPSRLHTERKPLEKMIRYR